MSEETKEKKKTTEKEWESALRYSYFNPDAEEGCDEKIVHVQANRRVVAQRDIQPNEVLYTGRPLLHTRTSEIADVVHFLGLLDARQFEGVFRATRDLCPRNGRQSSDRVSEERFRDDRVYQVATRFLENAFRMHADRTEATPDPRWVHARNLYGSVASKLNHSCDPNCVWVVGAHDYIEVRSMRPIAKGVECTIPYWFYCSEMFLGASRERRRAYIKQHGGFDCDCLLCQEGPNTLRSPLAYLDALETIGVLKVDRSRACLNCGAVGEALCRACGVARYCGSECQRAHWRASHKNKCPRTRYKYGGTAQGGGGSRSWIISFGELSVDEAPVDPARLRGLLAIPKPCTPTQESASRHDARLTCVHTKCVHTKCVDVKCGSPTAPSTSNAEEKKTSVFAMSSHYFSSAHTLASLDALVPTMDWKTSPSSSSTSSSVSSPSWCASPTFQPPVLSPLTLLPFTACTSHRPLPSSLPLLPFTASDSSVFATSTSLRDSGGDEDVKEVSAPKRNRGNASIADA